MNLPLRHDAFEPFIFSPAEGALVSLYGLQAEWDHSAQADRRLIARAEAGFLYAKYLWVFLAFLLAVALPFLTSIAVCRLIA